MKTPKTVQEGDLIAFVSGNLEMLRASDYNSNDIRVTIGRMGKDGAPRNWSLNYDEAKTSTGGCYARVFASGNRDGSVWKVLFGSYGPEATFADMGDFEHGLRALKLIQKRLEAMRDVRGPIFNALEHVQRWLEATGVSVVLVRPDKSQEEWLNRGEWLSLPIGRFVQEKLKPCFPEEHEAIPDAIAA